MTCSHRPLRALSVGEGPALVLLHGYAMRPETYLPLARLLGRRARVVIPAIFELDGVWRFRKALAALESTLDALGLERVALLGHLFGGGLELGFAASRPERVAECVFADTLGVHASGASRPWTRPGPRADRKPPGRQRGVRRPSPRRLRGSRAALPG